MKTLLLLSFASILATNMSAQTPPWKLSEEEIRSRAFHLTAGKSLQPESWPGGARVAVLLSFDIDAQTWDLKSETPSLTGLSQGEYGPRVGLRRIVKLLDEKHIPATFFVPVVPMMLHPDIVDVVSQSGRHELGVHGWIHEHATTLSAEEERALIERMLAFFEEHAGGRPVGYRAPGWVLSRNTIGILRELGFLYDSSLMADDRPYEINEQGKPTGLVELPVEWMLDDASLVDPRGDNYTPPRELLRVFIDEFEKAYDEGTMFLLTMHPRVIGHRPRMVVLEELIAHIQSKDKVWFATHREAAEYVKECCLSR
jgi:peptidoglycan/xylan/chitin deacetylase (PgdA/CDA1 family)